MGQAADQTWHRLGLAAVVLASTGLALVWVFLVPIYQSPDEPQHLDYALAINAHRGLFQLRADKPQAAGSGDPRRALGVHPYTVYLMERTQTKRVIHRAQQKMTPDYGTWDYFRALDRDAPPWSPVDEPGPLAYVYPYGYYAVLAVWIEALRWVRDKPVFVFFGARLSSVLLLAATLLLAHATARRLHVRPGRALVLTACVGLFPLTTFVSSYVQPDNLAFTLVSLAYYLALRLRQEPANLRLYGALGLCLGLLLVTKVHYFLCVAMPIVVMLAVALGRWGTETFGRAFRRGQETRAERMAPRFALAAVLLLAPSAVTGAVYAWTVQGTGNYYGVPAPHSGGLRHALRWFQMAVVDFYATLTHQSFWGVFGWMDTPLVIGQPRTNELVQYAILYAGWMVLGLALWRLEQVASRLVRLFGRGRRWTAVRLAVSNPVINSYFLFTVLMFYLFNRLENRFAAQGRNWLPFLLPIFLVGLVYAPKALTLRRSRAALSFTLTAGLLLYCVVGSYYSIRTLKQRFYPRAQPPPIEERATFACGLADYSPGCGSGSPCGAKPRRRVFSVMARGCTNCNR